LENNRIGSVGRPLSNVEIKLTSEGEVIAKGPNIMKGYYKRDDISAEVIKDGWLYTGDIGRIDDDGYVYITGRLKDIIVTGSGVNVYPDEIEFYLNKLPGVLESCVLGVKIKEGIRRWMEEVFAVIVPDGKQSEEKIKEEIAKLNEKLTEYKRVANVIIRTEELPKTTTKKVKRFQVRKELNL
jgi:long-chain acyl-CoA synthetase